MVAELPGAPLPSRRRRSPTVVPPWRLRPLRARNRAIVITDRCSYMIRLLPLSLGLFLATATSLCTRAAEPSPADIGAEQLRFFESKVRPLLVEHCYECHSVESGESSGELLVDSAAGLRKGGSLGAALVPGKPEQSRLMRAIEYRDSKLQMPPDGKLKPESIEILRHWIKIGAPDPRQQDHDSGASATLAEASPLDRDPRTHWAFNPPNPIPAPQVESDDSRDPIDAFARRRAAEAGLQPVAEATREVLIRRLYFDLTGLPPTQNDVDRFVQSDHPSAYTRLVDRLLSTPDFGQRFARHWLDVARYADTVGYALAGRERRFTGSERFRDWAIRAFAQDMPYDEMIHHQLAGERTDPENQEGNLDAMGFLTLGRKFLNPLDTIDDRIDVISRGLLGMTVSCARCHDHKFDPIPSSDYYSLGGIIFSSEQPKDGPSPLMLVDKKNPVDSPVLIRGQRGNRGPIAPRQFLTALRKEGEPRFTDGSGRWELARRITAADNPLTARVMVNRIWGHLIGKPLVETPSDFGFRTQPPAVPEVLEELASDFSHHWSIKRTIRRIVLSRIYRQSTLATEESIAKDPDNGLLARANRRRRDFESLRDSALHVAGALDRSLGGAPVEITLDTLNPKRTIYALIDRQNLPSIFRTFDFANPDAHSPTRYFTTVPQQALFLLNNRQAIELARSTAKQVRSEVSLDDHDALCRAMFQQVLARAPSETELSAASEFLKRPPSEIEPTLDMRALWSYGTAEVDDRQRVSRFTPFTIFKSNRWQTSQKFPADPPMGYAYLSTENGHTPHDTQRAVVRRFTAPFSGQVRLRGQMAHRSESGDGFRATIWIGDEQKFSETQKKNNRPYGPIKGRIEAGQTIDLVAAPGQSDSFDTFSWRVSIRLIGDDGRVLESESMKHFSGPFDPESNQPLDRLGQLAQILLMSNEFAFVD